MDSVGGVDGDEGSTDVDPEATRAEPTSSASAPPTPETRVLLETSDAPDGGLTGGKGEIGPGTFVGRFVLLHRAGSGGMGEVFAAYDPELDRKVAVKVLRWAARAGGIREASLLTEAQAMAKVAHPNVVAVYDVGTVSDSVYIAMELVSGGDLRGWLDRHRPPVSEVLALFAGAGAGLAAAHERGLIHRDFKPGNVLVTEGGRPKVMDFGLARPAEGTAGEIAGTPAYMSPEQFLGEPLDARSDQYSFCAALYEALYDTRPYVGGTFAEQSELVLEGALPNPPRRRDIPERTRGAVVRGLSRAPADRFPDMDALLAELRAESPHAIRRILLTTAAVATLGVVVLTSTENESPPPPEACVPSGVVRSVYDGERESKIRAAFTALPGPYAKEAVMRALPRLQRRARALSDADVQLCESRRHDDANVKRLDARAQCLVRKRLELEYLAREFESPSPGIVERAVSMTATLSPLEECDSAKLGDREALASEAFRSHLGEVETALAQAGARRLAGEYEAAAAGARHALELARSIEHGPSITRALLLLGRVEADRQKGEEAIAVFHAAISASERAGLDRLRARAMVQLLGTVANLDEHHGEMALLERLTLAAISRVGDAPDLQIDLNHALGTYHYLRQDWAQAEKHFKAVADLRETHQGAEHVSLGSALNNLANVYLLQARHPEALPLLERSMAIRRKHLGPHHPHMGAGLMAYADTLNGVGRSEEAVAAAEEAVTLLESTHPDGHPWVGMAHHNLAEIHAKQERWDESEAADSRAIAVFERIGDEEGYAIATAYTTRAYSRVELNRYADALEDADGAIAIKTRLRGPDHAAVAISLGARGRALAGLGRHAEAVDALERAVTLQAAQPDHVALAELRFFLAEVVFEDDPQRARDLVRKSIHRFRKDEERYTQDLEQLDDWLESHVK